jgi:phosphatidylglycerophosphate synthase
MNALRRLRADYLATLKAPEVEEALDLALYRPLAYLFVQAIRRTPITPNQITLSSIGIGLAAGYLFWLGTPASLLWGAVVVIVFNVFDCADGMLARVKNMSSPLGYMLDGLADYIGTLAIAVGIGHAVAMRHPQHLLWWSLTLAAAISFTWWCAVVEGMRLEWMRRIYGRRQDRAGELADLVDAATQWRREGSHRFERLIVGAYVIYVRLWEGRCARDRSESREDSLPAEVWAEVNRPLLRLAVATGPSMQLTVIIVTAALNRPEWLLWSAVTVSNLWAAGVLLARFVVRRRLLAQPVAEV